MKYQTLLVFNGSKWQMPLIKKLLEDGYDVAVLTYYPDSPAFDIVQKCVLVDLSDKEQCLKYAVKFMPDAVITSESDIVIPAMAYVAEKLGIPAISTEMAELFTNKQLMREYCFNNNFYCPQFFLCSNVEEAIDVFRKFGKKMIMKPINSNGSKGVVSIEKEMDIISYFDGTAKYNVRTAGVILEEYIEGTEFTVDGIKTDGGHSSLAISKKNHYDNAENVAKSLYFTNYSNDYDYDYLREYNDYLIEKTNLSFGLTHVEYKYKDGRYYLIEMAARGGGSGISTIIEPWISGVDVYDYLIKMSFGQLFDKKIKTKKETKERCALLYFFDIPCEGIVKEISGIEKMKKINQIKDWSISIKKGDKVKYALDDTKRAGYYIALGETIEELNTVVNEVNENLVINVEREK